MKQYTADELRDLPTLSQGQFDNLKVQTEHIRVWLSRCGIADGMEYDDQITVEQLTDGCWVTVGQYPGSLQVTP